MTFTLPPQRTHFPVNLDGHVARATLSRLSLNLSLFATMPFSFFRASQCPLFFTFILFFFPTLQPSSFLLPPPVPAY